MVMDEFGAHAEGCMGGGDKVVTHNECRNTIHRQSVVAGARPELEKGGLLSGLGWHDVEGKRPADTLLCSTAGVLTGSGRNRPRIALDVGVVNPQAQGHRTEAAQRTLGAAGEYIKKKCAHNDTERRCQEAGIEFQPVVFESLGGVSEEADRV